MTAQELAEELEVSVRTIYRDVESLGAAGVPLYADRGPAGGYQLLDGYRTRLTGLTSGEAESLFLAGIPGPAAELGLGTVLAGAQLKLLAALPPELRSRAGRIRERFHLDAPGWFQESDELPHLAAVADAVWNQHALHVRYRRWGGEVDRTLDPLGLVLKAGVWYLVARVSGQVRTYRVSRILELETLNQCFERPEGFDLAGYWQTWAEQFQTRLYKAEAVIRLSPRAIGLLPHFFTPEASRAAKASARPVDPDGWVQVVLPIETIEHAFHDLLRFGADAEVVAPRALREQMTGAADALARIYRNR
jgi:predicted DNA-binding transcriptional regulator YafY